MQPAAWSYGFPSGVLRVLCGFANEDFSHKWTLPVAGEGSAVYFM